MEPRIEETRYRERWTRIAHLKEAETSANAEARSIAAEFVERSWQNLERLRSRLLLLGYEFANLGGSLLEATSEDLLELSSLEHTYGKFPILLHAWYSRIGRVDFRQHQSQLFTPAPQDRQGVKLNGLGYNASLWFLRLSECVVAKQRLVEKLEKVGYSHSHLSNFLPIGGAASNSEPRGVFLPQRAFDSIIYNDGFKEVTFAQEIRSAFQMGGFPFWRRYQQVDASQLIPPCPRPDIESVIPILIAELRAV